MKSEAQSAYTIYILGISGNEYGDKYVKCVWFGVFFFQAEDGIRDADVTWSSDVCSSDLEAYPFMRWYGSGTGLPCVAGQSGQWRRVKWLVLHPRRVTNNRHNDDSCVVRVTIGQHSVLIPGDITYRAERQLLAFIAPVASDILVLAHHGSNSSSERLFLAAVNPQLAIVSRGRNNAYGMVATPVKERLNELQIPLLDTALGGQITLRFNSSEWSVEQPWAGADRPWFDSDN